MANCMNRCPRCGRIRRNPARRFTGGASCAAELNNARDLYEETVGTTATGDYRVCCDAYGCRTYNCSNRSRFWPSFCHPRWLTCDQLYRRVGR